MNARPRLRILVVSPRAETIREWLKRNNNTAFNLSIHVAMEGMTGLHKVQMHIPVFIIVDNDLPDMNGISFASIAKDSIEGQGSKILVFGVDKFLENMRIDFFLPPMPDNMLESFLSHQLESFLQSNFFMDAHREEYETKKQEQINMLPPKIDTNWVSVSSIFSPYDQLSGDGFDYWISPQNSQEESGILYGFLYDCTGHGPESYPLVESIRSLLEKNIRLYEFKRFQSLSDVMERSNATIMDTTPANDLTPTAAVTFHVDFHKNKLRYCTAGIPCFFVRYAGEHKHKKIDCRNFLLGMFPGVEYDENEMDLVGVDELVFSSDGFSELIFHQQDTKAIEAKHDDVSAVIIRLKRPETTEI